MNEKRSSQDSFFLPSNDCDQGYKNVRDNPNLCGSKDYELKNHVESLWATYRRYADHNFLSDACMHFQERYWEMYLGVSFLKHGFTIKKVRQAGPEFYLETNKGKKYGSKPLLRALEMGPMPFQG